MVAFRGLNDQRQFFSTFNNFSPSTRLNNVCAGCTAGPGFLSGWTTVQAEVLANVRTAMAQNPGFSILCVGHSLGGAISHHAAVILRQTYPNVTLVS